MKLLRHGPAGAERPGLLDASGTIRDLSGHLDDIGPAALSPSNLERLRGLDPESLPAVPGQPRLGPPVTGTQKFLAIGLNYADHAAESNMPIPSEPIVFTKANSCIQGPDDEVMLPRDSVKSDWEVELGVVIGTQARNVEEADALSHVAGYVLVNDLSEREWQLERGGSWDKGKGCDSFGPIGPYLVTKDEVPDPLKLNLWLKVNGKTFQNGSTDKMVFGPAFLVHYLSQFMSLQPGDVISTGTPPGVGLGQKPPLYLNEGDVVELGIEGMGVQKQVVVNAK